MNAHLDSDSVSAFTCHPRRLAWLILGCLLGLSLVPTGRAQNSQNVEIRLAPGRAGHGFAFAPPDNPGAMTGGSPGSLITGATGGQGWL